jgi:hypothetical protein
MHRDPQTVFGAALLVMVCIVVIYVAFKSP